MGTARYDLKTALHARDLRRHGLVWRQRGTCSTRLRRPDNRHPSIARRASGKVARTLEIWRTDDVGGVRAPAARRRHRNTTVPRVPKPVTLGVPVGCDAALASNIIRAGQDIPNLLSSGGTGGNVQVYNKNGQAPLSSTRGYFARGSYDGSQTIFALGDTPRPRFPRGNRRSPQQFDAGERGLEKHRGRTAQAAVAAPRSPYFNTCAMGPIVGRVSARLQTVVGKLRNSLMPIPEVCNQHLKYKTN